VSSVADYDGAFATMAQGRVGAVLVHASTLTVRDDPRLLAKLALKHRLPTIFGSRDNVVAGGLMGYAPDMNDLHRRRGLYRQDPQGGHAGRPAGRAGFQVPAGHQSQDRERARPEDPAIDPRARRRGHRVGDELFSGANSGESFVDIHGVTWCRARASR
jgi:hypothetical protein